MIIPLRKLSNKKHWNLGVHIVILAVSGFLWLVAFGHHETHATSETIDLMQLLEATESREAAFRNLGSYKYSGLATMPADLQPLWPVYSFLWAEIYLLRGDSAQARRIYQNIVEWSSNDPYIDNWGGSGLAIVSFWRWVQLAEKTPDVTHQEKETLLSKASMLWKNQPRLARGMFNPPPFLNLSSLPQLKENFLRSLSSLAWSLNRKEDARRFFIEYLSVATTGDLTPSEQELFAEATSSGALSLPKVALLLGARLVELGDYDGAAKWLKNAMDSGGSQVRTEASLYLAKLLRIREKCLTKPIKELLDTAINESSDPELIQQSLYFATSRIM